MSSSAPSPELLALVNDFLASNGFDKAAKALSKQAKDQSITLAANTNTTLTALFDARPKEAAAAADDSSDASDSSDDESSDSDSESEDEKKPVKKAATKARKVTPPSSSSSDSESSEDEKPAVKKTKTAKKADTSSDSSSASSSSESESSDSSDSSDSDSSDSDSDSSSSSSSSDSDSDSDSSSSSSDSDSSSSSDSDSSDSESESDKKKKSAKAAKVEKPVKKEVAEKKEKKSVAKSEPSSDSAASSVTLADAPAPLKAEVDTIMVPANSALGQAEGTAVPSNDAEEHMHPSRKRKLGGAFGEAEQQVAVPATDENIKRAKKENVPFSRIPKDQYVDPRLVSNAFVPYDYAQKAHEALIVTKGKAFTKAKNKGKRGSYRGGIIDQTPKGIQFDD